jgi:hypothetical protein
MMRVMRFKVNVQVLFIFVCSAPMGSQYTLVSALRFITYHSNTVQRRIEPENPVSKKEFAKVEMRWARC